MLGIALVVDDTRKGPKLAFSYPLSMLDLTSPLLASKKAEGGAAQQSSAGSKSRDPKGDASSAQNESAAADYFARLFRPKPSLCNAPFILTLETTVFISYPIVLPIQQHSKAPAPAGTLSSSATAAAEIEKAVSPALSIAVSVDKQQQYRLGDEYDLDFVGSGTALASSPHASNPEGFLGPSPSIPSTAPATGATSAGALTSNAASTTTMPLSSGGLLVSTVATAGPTEAEVDSKGKGAHSSGTLTSNVAASTATRGVLSLFNVVFVIDAGSQARHMRRKRAAFRGQRHRSSPPDGEPVTFATTAEFSDYLEEILNELDDEDARELLVHNFIDCAQRLAGCLWFEEKRGGYVTRQASSMLNIATFVKERLSAPGIGGASGNSGPANTLVRRVGSDTAATLRTSSFVQPGEEKEAVMKDNASVASSTVPPAPVLQKESSFSLGGTTPLATNTSTSGLHTVLKQMFDTWIPSDVARSTLALTALTSDAPIAETSVLESSPLLALSLGWELAYVFHSLRHGLGSGCHMKVNNWLSLSLSLSAFSPNKASSYLLADFDVNTAAPHVSAASEVRAVQELMIRSTEKSPMSGVPTAMGDSSGVPSARLLPSPLRSTPPLSTPPLSSLWQYVRDRRTEAKMMPIRPYHTLLLLHDTADVLRSLPSDASPQLVQLICAATPLRSFNELQGETGIPSSQLLRLAAHLVHWGLAIITNVITNHNVYTVSPTADINPLSAATTEFSALFNAPTSKGTKAGFELASVLSLFSKVTYSDIQTAAAVAAGSHMAAHTFSTAAGAPAPYASPYMGGSSAFMSGPPPHIRMLGSAEGTSSDASAASFVATTGTGIPLRTLMQAMLPQRAARFIEVLTWLLKHGFLRQMHTSVYLLWPFPLRRPADSAFGVNSVAGSPTAPMTPMTATSPTAGLGATTSVPWSQDEWTLLQDLCRAKPAPLVPLFRRLVTYLRDTMANFGPALDFALDDTSREIETSSSNDIFDADGMNPILKLGLRLEEIMWRLHMSRADLLQVLATFPEVLITSMHD